MYKNNSGLIAKTKVSKYKKGLCLTEKLVRENPLLFLYETVVRKFARTSKENRKTFTFRLKASVKSRFGVAKLLFILVNLVDIKIFST